MPTRPYESIVAESYIAQLAAAKGTPLSIQQVEIVRTHPEGTKPLDRFITGVLLMGIRVLVVWWFFAAWLPELGYTYWQLILPVFAVRGLFSGRPLAKAPKSSLEKWAERKRAEAAEKAGK